MSETKQKAVTSTHPNETFVKNVMKKFEIDTCLGIPNEGQIKLLIDNRADVQNALILSWSTYETDPFAYLDEQKKNHSFTSIVSNVDCKCPFVIAEDSGSKRVYLAFKGTSSLDDLLTDLEAFPRQAERTPSVGTFHSGFLKRAESFPLDTLLGSEGMQGKTLILCGHSLGGAVSSIVYLEIAKKLKRANEESPLKGLQNITFGSPLFASEDYRHYIDSMPLAIEMYHFVAHNDPVPRLVTLVLSALHKKIAQMPAKEKLLQNISNCLRNHSNAILLGLDAMQFASSPNSAELFKDVKNFLKACMQPPEALEQSMVPIGHFFFLKDKTITAVSYEDQESLKRHLRIHENQIDVSGSLRSHYLNNYRRLSEINKCFVPTIQETDYDRRRLGAIKYFNPKIDNAKLEYDRIGETLKLTVEGRSLSSIQKQKCLFDFGFEFGGESTAFSQKSDSKIVLTQNKRDFRAPFSEFGCEIQIVNLFGKSWKYLLTTFSGMRLRKINEIAESDDVILLLETAFKRASDMQSINEEGAENHLFDLLIELAESVLDQSDVVKLRNIYGNNEGLPFNNQDYYNRIHKIMQSFKSRLHSSLTLEMSRSTGEKVIIVVGVVVAVAATTATAYARYLSRKYRLGKV